MKTDALAGLFSFVISQKSVLVKRACHTCTSNEDGFLRNDKRKQTIRELAKNKLPKFCEAIFSLDKAKNTGIAGLRRVFLTTYKGKRASKMGRLFFTNSLNYKKPNHLPLTILMRLPS